MKLLLAAVAVCAAAIGILAVDAKVPPAPPAAPAAPPPPAPPAPGRLVVHEWGTFTSFAGSDGAPVAFSPNNRDLPGFVYAQEDNASKGGRLLRGGTVSMETPVVYFYTDRDTRVAVKVDFPHGWITEWYPFATTPPDQNSRRRRADADDPGESIRWEVNLRPGGAVRFPRDERDIAYYHARETEAVPLEAEANFPGNPVFRGGTVTQRERFLFYRGVGTFPPPVGVKALGDGKVRVTNASAGKATGLVLVRVHQKGVGFRVLENLDAGAQAVATLPDASGDAAELGGAMAKALVAAGLYEAEARAMVKTWDAAWFKEEGTRLLYVLPRSKTDELLPLTVEPKPAEVVRVLVGRYDFLTPEQESAAARLVVRSRKAQAEVQAAEQELAALGRFAPQAREMAEKRLEPVSTPTK